MSLFNWDIFCEQRYVSDFYISDFQSGLRALVKAGYGAKVAPFVKPATVVNVTKGNRDLSPSFLRWLTEHNLSSDDCTIRLKEGYATDSLFCVSVPLGFCKTSLIFICCMLSNGDHVICQPYQRREYCKCDGDCPAP